MAQDDYQLLEDYTEWREEKLLHEVDTSVEAFKAEREAGANAWRIEKTLDVIGHVLSVDHDESDLETMNIYYSTLEQVRDALAGDRKYEEIHTLTSTAVKRVYS